MVIYPMTMVALQHFWQAVAKKWSSLRAFVQANQTVLLNIGYFGIAAFLFVGFLVNAMGTPPPSVTALWVMAIALGAFTLWLSWFADRHRRS